MIAAGRARDEAVAFVANATTPAQSVTPATLGHRRAVAATLPTRDPTLIVIGPVVALRDMLCPWQQAAPMTLQPEPMTAAGA